MKNRLVKGIAILLSASMMVGAVGCGEVTQAETASIYDSAAEDTTDESATEASENDEKEADLNEPKEKVHINDFDEYVNADWKKEQAEKGQDTVTRWDEKASLTNDRIRSILTDTDLSGLSADDGLYKTVLFYQQVIDISDAETRIETIKKHLAPIENVKTLEDLYALYGNEEYSLYNGLLKFSVKADSNGYNALTYNPNSFTQGLDFYNNVITDTSADNQTAREAYLLFMESLGYSEKRTGEMIANAMKAGKYIDDYTSDTDALSYYLDSQSLRDGNVSVPVIDILVNLSAFGKRRKFTAKEDFCDLVNKLYTLENIEIIKDHYLFMAITMLSTIASEDMLIALDGMNMQQVASSILFDQADDVLHKEYQNRFLEKELLETAQSMTEDFKDEVRNVISETEWLSPHGKELAKHKLMNMKAGFGLNVAGNYFEDVEMTDNTVENYISILVSNARFNRQQTRKEDDQRDLFDADLYEVDGRYMTWINSFYVTNAVLGTDRISKDSSYEEKLALLGAIIGHEIAHSYGPSGIDFDYHGYYEPWMTEEEAAAYQANIQKISEYFDGMEIEYGEKIDGELVTNEAFADLLAVESCLRLLEKQEAPDYDLFFRTYAADHARFYSREGAKKAVTNEHLPGKQRINCILGQFDKFYETYDIDETSPFYVPEDKRLKTF